jgi:hypothetical protein
MPARAAASCESMVETRSTLTLCRSRLLARLGPSMGWKHHQVEIRGTAMPLPSHGWPRKAVVARSRRQPKRQSEVEAAAAPVRSVAWTASWRPHEPRSTPRPPLPAPAPRSTATVSRRTRASRPAGWSDRDRNVGPHHMSAARHQRNLREATGASPWFGRLLEDGV